MAAAVATTNATVWTAVNVTCHGVGYGLDYRERDRNLPDILRVDDLAALRSDPDVLAPLLTDAAA